MNSWLAKFRISAALDAGTPFSPSLQKAIAADPELERFARRTQELGRALPMPPPANAALHDSIMRAVRTSARREQPQRAPIWAWLTSSTALAAIAFACVWVVSHRLAPVRGQALDGAAQVLEISEQMPAAMPSYVMAPLSNEWAKVDHDLQNTKQVLLASFP